MFLKILEKIRKNSIKAATSAATEDKKRSKL